MSKSWGQKLSNSRALLKVLELAFEIACISLSSQAVAGVAAPVAKLNRTVGEGRKTEHGLVDVDLETRRGNSINPHAFHLFLDDVLAPIAVLAVISKIL
jgi:hypothetical protein